MNSQDVEQTKLLREILKWIRFAGMKEVKSVLDAVLDNIQKKQVYQLSDGSRGIIEIGKLTGISSTVTIWRYWRNWLKLGLGETVSAKGGERFKRSFDLEELGFEIPSVGSGSEKKEDVP
jgi:hypothetical protein